jgi:hypothetical protein
MGTMVYGQWKDNPGPGTYEAALVCAECLVVGVNAGVDAFSRWSFLNRGDVDGQWQMIETWDRKKNVLREKFTPMPNVYYVYGLLSRLTAKNSAVITSRVHGGTLENEQWRTNIRHAYAAALRSPDNHLTLAIVNDAKMDWDLTVALSGLNNERKLYRYSVTPAQRDRDDIEINSEKAFTLSASQAVLSDQLPARSLTVYTTYDLAHGDAGVMTE